MLKGIIKGKIEENILAITMLFIIVLVFWQAASRFLIGTSISWGSELAIYLHILQVWVGASLAVRTGENVRIEFFVNLFPRQIKFYLNLLALLIWFLFALFLAIVGSMFVYEIFESMQRTPTMRILLGIPYLAVPFGGLLMSFRLIEQIYYRFKKYKNESVTGKGE
jgi:TRAP-type C4-dicarboxylate transport system permease small subunit